MAGGDIGLFFIVKRPNGSSEYALCRSADEGQSFKHCVYCIPDQYSGYYVINNCRVLRTSSGRWIVPAALHRKSEVQGGYRMDGRATAYFFGSDDDGKTWRELPGCVTLSNCSYSNTGLQEPGVLELANGCLYAYFRTDRHVQYESFSPDNGRTWTAAQPSRFTSPVSPMKIARNPYSGVYYAVWNPVPNYNGRKLSKYGWGRTPLAIAHSEDGLTFSEPVMIEDDPERGYCYPAIFFLDERTILLAYCSGGEKDKACLCRTTIKKISL
jgi:hypothetical protein